MKTSAIRGLALLLVLTSCVQPGQSQYGYQDVGHTTVIEFGIVEDSRPVDITGKNTGTGGAAGLATGAVAGSFIGHGNGSLIGLLGGAIIGGIAGHLAEQSLQDHKGIEYTITLDMGKTITIVQNIKKEDAPLSLGARCMVQTSGVYQRVLPSNKPFPDEEPVVKKHPKRHHHEDDDDDADQ